MNDLFRTFLLHIAGGKSFFLRKYSNTNSNCKLEIAKYYYFSSFNRQGNDYLCTVNENSLSV